VYLYLFISISFLTFVGSKIITNQNINIMKNLSRRERIIKAAKNMPNIEPIIVTTKKTREQLNAEAELKANAISRTHGVECHCLHCSI